MNAHLPHVLVFEAFEPIIPVRLIAFATCMSINIESPFAVLLPTKHNRDDVNNEKLVRSHLRSPRDHIALYQPSTGRSRADATMLGAVVAMLLCSLSLPSGYLD